MKYKLQRVEFMPKVLEPGILYFAEEYDAVAHLCACGCGTKIRTPVGPTEWKLTETGDGPTLYPSIGNWQQKCRSHYWITAGEVEWSYDLSPEEVAEGRRGEEARRRRHYDAQPAKRSRKQQRWWQRLMRLLRPRE